MATDGGLFRALSCITLREDIPQTNPTETSPTCNTLTTTREQARQRALVISNNMETNRERNKPEYKQARAELLRDQPICHWCRRAEATELDHLVESDSGGMISDGYVPACKPCNSRRGAEYINKKTATRMQNRNNGFLYKEIKPPHPKKQKKHQKN